MHVDRGLVKAAALEIEVVHEAARVPPGRAVGVGSSQKQSGLGVDTRVGRRQPLEHLVLEPPRRCPDVRDDDRDAASRVRIGYHKRAGIQRRVHTRRDLATCPPCPVTAARSPDR